MAIILAANNAGTTLAGSLSPTATTVSLSTGTGALFPHPAAGQYFVATLIPQTSTTGLPNEIVWVTNVTGDTATIVRAQEGTTALSFVTGDSFQNLWTAGSFATLIQQGQLQSQTTNYAIDSGTANNIIASLTPAPTSLASITGSAIRIKKAGASNTGAVNVTLNGFGPVPLVLPGGGALTSGSLQGNGILEMVYDGTSWELLSGRPQSGSATPSGPAGGDLTGTYPNPTVAPLAVTNAKLAQMAAKTFKANNTNGSATPTDIALSLIGSFIGFTVSTTATGTAFTIPGEFIIQMGIAPAHSQNDGQYAITLPVNFGTAIAAVTNIINPSADPNVDYNTDVVALSTSSLTLFNNNSSSTGGAGTPHQCYWIAVGLP